MNALILLLLSLVLFSSCISNNSKKTGLLFHVNISTPTSDAVANLEQGGLVIRMSDRYYVSSLLSDVFGPSSNTEINYLVKIKMDSFGGGCDQYDMNQNVSGACLNDDCNNVVCSGAQVINNQIGVSSVIRRGWLIRVCESISNDDYAILYAVQNIHSQPTLTKSNVPAPTKNTLEKSYGLFYRSSAPDKAILSALTDISKEETNNFEKWRYVLLSICTTAEWQIP